MNYTKDDLLTLGKRYNNPKRSYLLIDPLQAKHIPVSPSAALEMMHTLGRKLLAKVPDADCIIGFAETATAVAAAAASEFPDNTFYIHTTRENFERVVYFSEEHSHASEQCLCEERIDAHRFDSVILIDDEFSTGKTLMNIIEVLKKIPAVKNAKFTAGSVINRIPAEKLAEFHDNGVDFVSLCDIHDDDFEERAKEFEISAPVEDIVRRAKDHKEYSPDAFGGNDMLDMRMGGSIGDIRRQAEAFADIAAEHLSGRLNSGDRILVMGTEEFMYQPLILGKKLESMGFEVYSHSTTRSPIGVLDHSDYPIRSGFRIRSFYDKDRVTYIYNVQKYDKIIVMTDSSADSCVTGAMNDITSVFDADSFCLVRYPRYR